MENNYTEQSKEIGNDLATNQKIDGVVRINGEEVPFEYVDKTLAETSDDELWWTYACDADWISKTTSRTELKGRLGYYQGLLDGCVIISDFDRDIAILVERNVRLLRRRIKQVKRWKKAAKRRLRKKLLKSAARANKERDMRLIEAYIPYPTQQGPKFSVLELNERALFDIGLSKPYIKRLEERLSKRLLSPRQLRRIKRDFVRSEAACRKERVLREEHEDRIAKKAVSLKRKLDREMKRLRSDVVTQGPDIGLSTASVMVTCGAILALIAYAILEWRRVKERAFSGIETLEHVATNTGANIQNSMQNAKEELVRQASAHLRGYFADMASTLKSVAYSLRLPLTLAILYYLWDTYKIPLFRVGMIASLPLLIDKSMLTPISDFFRARLGMVDQVEQQSTSTHSMLSQLLAMGFSAHTAFNSKKDTQAAMLQHIGTLPRVTAGFEQIVDFALNAFEALYKFVGKYIELPHIRFGPRMAKDVEDVVCEAWALDKVMATDAKLKKPRELNNRLMSCYTKIATMLSLYHDNQPVRAELVQVRGVIASHLTALSTAVGRCSGSRKEPVTIIIEGDAGIGKTFQVDLLMGLLMKLSGIRPDLTMKDIDSVYYTKAANTPYFDGYYGQECYYIDDLFAIRPNPNKDNTEYQDIMAFHSSFTTMLNMADCPKKGMFPFTSSLILATTNVKSLKEANAGEILAHQPAFLRRINFHIHLEVKEEFRVPGTGELDTEKYGDECLRLIEEGKTGFEAHPWHIWQYHDTRFSDEQITYPKVGKCFSTLVPRVVEALKKKERVFQAIQAHLGRVLGTGEKDPVTSAIEDNKTHYESLKDKVLDLKAKFAMPVNQSVEDEYSLLPPTPPNSVDSEYAILESLIQEDCQSGPSTPSSCPTGYDTAAALKNMLAVHSEPIEITSTPKTWHDRAFEAWCAEEEERLRNPSPLQTTASKVKDWWLRTGEVRTLVEHYEKIERAKPKTWLEDVIENKYDHFKAFCKGFAYGCGAFVLAKMAWEASKWGYNMLKRLVETVKDGVLALFGTSNVQQSNGPKPTKVTFGAQQQSIETNPLWYKVYSNSYKMTAAGKNEHVFGQIIFVRDFLAMMPHHFLTSVKSLKDKGELSDDTQLRFQCCGTSDKAFRTTVKVFLQSSFWRVPNEDVVFVNFDKKVGMHANITKFFANEGDYKNHAGQRVRLDTHARQTYITHSAAVGKTKLRVQGGTTYDKWYQYGADTDYGDCGAPLCLSDHSNFGVRLLIGIHVAGNPGLSHGFATPVTQEMCAAAASHFNIVTIPEASHKDSQWRSISVEALPEPQSTFVGMEDIGIVSQPVSSPIRTNLSLTPVGEERALDASIELLSGKKPEPIEPVRLRPITTDDGTRDQPMANAIHPFTTDTWIPPEADFKKGLSMGMQRFADASINARSDKLTFEEAVLGIPEIGLKSITRGTSVGYPLCTQYKSKADIFGIGDEFDLTLEEAVVLRREVEILDDLVCQGIRPQFVCRDFLKDETRKKGKGARLIAGTDIRYYILCRMYFGAYVAAIIKTHQENGICLGMNPYKEWGALRRFLTVPDPTGNNVWDGDFAGFDSSQDPAVLWACCDYICNWYHVRGQGQYNAQRRILFMDVVYSRHLCAPEGQSSVIVQWNKSLPSGHFLTSTLNSMISLGLIATGFFALTGETAFWEYCAAIVLGDDNVVTCCDEFIERFNQVTLSEYLAKWFNMTYTAGRKGEALTPHVGIDKVIFLQRRFAVKKLKGAEVDVCPLRPESFLLSMYYTRAKNEKKMRDIFVSSAELALQELAMHPEEHWNAVSSDITKALKDVCGVVPQMNTETSEEYLELVRMRVPHYI